MLLIQKPIPFTKVSILFEIFRIVFSVIFVGDSSVGKTSIINAFKEKDDIDVNPTIGLEFTNSFPFEVGNPPEEICFQIWDTGFRLIIIKVIEKSLFMINSRTRKI